MDEFSRIEQRLFAMEESIGKLAEAIVGIGKRLDRIERDYGRLRTDFNAFREDTRFGNEYRTAMLRLAESQTRMTEAFQNVLMVQVERHEGRLNRLEGEE